MSNSYITITPLSLFTGNLKAPSALRNNFYQPVKLNLVDYATYNQSGSGGWQVVDRPKMVAATQWYDRSPFQLQFDAIIDQNNSNMSGINASTSIVSEQLKSTYSSIGSDGTLSYDSNTYFNVSTTIDSLNSTNTFSIEDSCIALESWMDKVDGTLTPPVLQIDGPIPGTQRLWVLYSLEFDDAVRDPLSGLRIQQTCKITLYEYQPPYANQTQFYNYSPTSQWTQTTQSNLQQYSIYTVKQGDTLISIANQFYGSATYVNNIATLNNITDTANLPVGTKLSLPVSS